MELFTQLQSIVDGIGSALRTLAPLFAVLAIGIGGGACFSGARFAKAVLGTAGFLAGASVAAALTLLVTSGNRDAVLIPALVGGALGAALCFAVYYAGLIVCGMLAGTLSGFALGGLTGGGPNIMVIVVLAFLGGWLFVAAEKTALTLLTAVSGAWVLVSGVSVLAGGGVVNLIDYLRNPSLAALGASTQFVAWVAISIAGALVQHGRIPGLPLKLPGAQLRGLLLAGAAVITCGALSFAALGSWLFPPPAIPAPTRANANNVVPRATATPAPGDVATSAPPLTLTVTSTPTPAATDTPAAAATRAPSPSPTRDPATYTFRVDGGPAVDRTRRCIGGYYIFGVVKDRQGQTLTGVRIKYGTATFFPPAAVTEAKGYELTVGANDAEWYVRVVDDSDAELSPVVVVRTTGLDGGNCWIRLDWRK